MQYLPHLKAFSFRAFRTLPFLIFYEYAAIIKFFILGAYNYRNIEIRRLDGYKPEVVSPYQ